MVALGVIAFAFKGYEVLCVIDVFRPLSFAVQLILAVCFIDKILTGKIDCGIGDFAQSIFCRYALFHKRRPIHISVLNDRTEVQGASFLGVFNLVKPTDESVVRILASN